MIPHQVVVDHVAAIATQAYELVLGNPADFHAVSLAAEALAAAKGASWSQEQSEVRASFIFAAAVRVKHDCSLD